MNTQKHSNIVILLLSILACLVSNLCFAAQENSQESHDDNNYLYSYRSGEFCGNAKYCFFAAKEVNSLQWGTAGDKEVLQLKNHLATKSIQLRQKAVKEIQTPNSSEDTSLFVQLKQEELYLDFFLLGRRFNISSISRTRL